jgi:hypothetical protein
MVLNEPVEKVVLLGDRAIVRTASALHVLERGGGIDPARSWDSGELGGPGLTASVTDFAVDPVPTPGGGVRIMAAIRRDRAAGPNDSLLVELRLDTSIELVRTATQAVELESVSISSEGRTAALSEQGEVALEEEDGSYSSRTIDDPSPDPKARSLEWIDPSQLVATSRNRIHFWDRSTDRFAAQVIVLPDQTSLHVFALHAGDGEVWAGGNGGWLARIDQGEVERLAVVPPPRHAACSTAQGDPSIFEDEVVDLALISGYAFVLLKRCSAVIAIRRSDRCMSLLDLDGGPPHLLDGEVDGLRAIDARGGVLLVGDARGRLFNVDL